MAKHLTDHLWLYDNPAYSDWPRPLRLMARTSKARWRANEPDAIAILIALSDLRRLRSVRAGGKST